MKKTLMVAALLVVGTSLAAQGSEISTGKLNETLITTENFETTVLDTAKDITIVTQEEIQNKGANTVAEALKGVPGLTVTQMDGGQPAFDLRGFGATGPQNTLVLLDGIPLNSVQGNGCDTSQIPVSIIDRIEVIPSGGSVMYGDGAVGGIINILTKAPQDRANYGSIGVEASSWNTLNGNIHYGTKVTDRLLMDVAYNHYKSHGYRSIANPIYNNDDSKETVWVRGKYLLDNGSVDVKYRHSNSDDYYSTHLTKEQFEDNPKQAGFNSGYSKFKEDSYTAKYDAKLADNVDFMLYGGFDKREYHGNSTNLGENHTIAKQYYVKPQVRYTYADNSYVILGGDYKDGKSENKIDNVKDQKRKSYAGYVMNKTTVGDFQFTQGFRHEKIDYDYYKDLYSSKIFSSKKFNANSWELGVNYLYSDTGSVYASYNHGFRGPTIENLNSWSGNIKMQKNDTYELGIKDMYKNTYVSASVFTINSDKEILYDANIYSNKNFNDKVRRNGAQISLEHYFDKLTLRENITYIQAKIKSGALSGNIFPNVPRWNASAGATYNFTDKLLGNFDVYYSSKSIINDDFANKYGKVNSYTTADLNIKYQFNEGLEVYTGIRNLFNKKYAIGVYNWGYGNSYFPADGRSYYAGFRYNF